MKRWSKWLVLFVICTFLVRIPDYWSVFEQDTERYKADTFYYVIKEEYKENPEGKRLYQKQFRDIENGDILVTDSTYCFCFRHGHAALVVDAEKGITLEAFGIGTISEYSKLSEWRRYPHVLVLRLKETAVVRQAIADYAKQQLVGIPYRISTGMVDDKDMDEAYWGTQCAHLVWAAFQAFGYDVDGDGGWLVTPADFTKSSLLQIVPQE